MQDDKIFAKLNIEMNLTAEEILNKYLAKNSPHAHEVARLSAMLFNELSKTVYEMPQRELEMLEAAALLHDIGYSVEAKSHNKHSRDIILKEKIEGFADEEVKIIACIARYHRGNLPDKNRHDLYGSFSKTERKIIKRLSGILKFADGLDVEHEPLIQEITTEYDHANHILKIILTPYSRTRGLNISKSLKKRDLLEVGFKCQSVVFIRNK